MWSSVLVLALPMALDPVRLGINLLMISRPRPAQNLLAYWAGCVSACVVLLLVPVTVLQLTPMFSSFARDLASPNTTTSCTLRHVEIFMGLLALSIAALIAVRFLVRQRAQLPARGAHTSTTVLDSNPPTPVLRLLGRAQDGAGDDGSAIRRLIGRVQNAWENGSLWVAVVIGFWAGPPPSLVIPVLAVILSSGAAIGTQISAVVVFTVVALAIVEIILVINLTAPTGTQGALRLLHDWVGARRRQILVTIFVVVGVTLMAQGMGGV